MCKGVLIRPFDMAIPSPGQIMLAAALYNRPMEAISYYPHNAEIVVQRKSFSIPNFTIIILIAIIVSTVASNSSSWTVLVLSFFTGFLAGNQVAQSRMHFEN
jgi:hypothetical protein